MLLKLNLVCLLLLLSQSLFAQGNVEMADALYSSGKIYIVVAVLMIIFIGIIIYLIQTDRKISALEKEWKNKSNKQ